MERAVKRQWKAKARAVKRQWKAKGCGEEALEGQGKGGEEAVEVEAGWLSYSEAVRFLSLEHAACVRVVLAGPHHLAPQLLGCRPRRFRIRRAWAGRAAAAGATPPPFLGLPLPIHRLSLAFHCLFTAFPWPSTASSLPFLDLPLPFLDLPLPFHCLSLPFHCLFTAAP